MALRLDQRLDELRYWRWRDTVAIAGWTLDGAPIAIGGLWPDRHGIHRFAATAEVPAPWPLEEARLVLDLGGESLVTLSAPNRQAQSFGLDPHHRELPVPHRQLAIAAEAALRGLDWHRRLHRAHGAGPGAAAHLGAARTRRPSRRPR